MSYEMVEQGAVVSNRSLPVARAPASEDPDAELVAAWQGGDDDAFEELVRRHEKRVFRLLMRMMGSREEAEDVAQETFISLFVYRVAANAALNRRRSLGRGRARLEKLAVRQAAGDDLPQQPRDPEDSTLGEELTSRVRDALQKLSPSLRMPVVLYDIEGLSYGEIASVLGVAEGTVKSRIHRARHALREELQGLLSGTERGASS